MLLGICHMQAEESTGADGEQDGGRPSRQQLRNVHEEIARDPHIRSLAHQWLDCYIYEEVETLGLDGALL